MLKFILQLTEMANAVTKKKKKVSKNKTTKVRDFNKDPFFVKKAKEATGFLKKHGYPSTVKK